MKVKIEKIEKFEILHNPILTSPRSPRGSLRFAARFASLERLHAG